MFEHSCATKCNKGFFLLPFWERGILRILLVVRAVFIVLFLFVTCYFLLVTTNTAIVAVTAIIVGDSIEFFSGF